jgi:hypothetical protein
MIEDTKNVFKQGSFTLSSLGFDYQTIQRGITLVGVKISMNELPAPAAANTFIYGRGQVTRTSQNAALAANNTDLLVEKFWPGYSGASASLLQLREPKYTLAKDGVVPKRRQFTYDENKQTVYYSINGFHCDDKLGSYFKFAFVYDDGKVGSEDEINKAAKQVVADLKQYFSM